MPVRDKVNHRVVLSPSNKAFDALPNTSVLESGLAAGVALSYGCASGSCGDCRAKIVSGTVSKSRFHDFALSELEKSEGICLLCSNTAESDLVIEVSVARSTEDIPQQKLRMKICHVEELQGVSIVRFKITRGKALRFLPGQYTNVTLPNGVSKILPIANCPCETSFVEFHLPANVIHDFPVDRLTRRDRVEIEGPVGTFTLTDKSATPDHKRSNGTCFISVGANFAAVKPMLEHFISIEIEEPLALIWVATDQAAQYHHNLCRSWADAFDWFFYIPVKTMSDLDAVLENGVPGIGSDILLDFYISAPLSQLDRISKKCGERIHNTLIVDDTLR